jgi:DNA-binding SARP family transcriptional activator
MTLFGRFSCAISGQEIVFARRRDRDILAYLALAPSGSVMRSDLLQVFWPTSTRTEALQGLRTTLCRLRRAIAIGGACSPDEYLHVGEVIWLHLDMFSVDARHFRRSLERADAEEARGDGASPLVHYLEAERLYAHDLLASEAHDGPLEPYVEAYRRAIWVVSARLNHRPQKTGLRSAIASMLDCTASD